MDLGNIPEAEFTWLGGTFGGQRSPDHPKASERMEETKSGAQGTSRWQEGPQRRSGEPGIGAQGGSEGHLEGWVAGVVQGTRTWTLPSLASGAGGQGRGEA